MNPWVGKSIALANGPGYLDALVRVYPVSLQGTRALPPSTKRDVKKAFANHDGLNLLRALLRLKRFPVKDPYVAYLRMNPSFLEYNPGTVRRLSSQIFAMGYDAVIEGCEAPAESNRQMGQLFPRWLRSLGYPLLPLRDFGKRRRGIVFLKASEPELKSYANEKLGAVLNKNPDFIAQVNGKYVIGEAKFLTATGGHQQTQFEDAMRLVKDQRGMGIKVAVLDGIAWVKSRNKMHLRLSRLDETALSALLLKDFLESLR
jgi:hypothetical protein